MKIRCCSQLAQIYVTCLVPCVQIIALCFLRSTVYVNTKLILLLLCLKRNKASFHVSVSSILNRSWLIALYWSTEPVPDCSLFSDMALSTHPNNHFASREESDRSGGQKNLRSTETWIVLDKVITSRVARCTCTLLFLAWIRA